ncbi:hypothetical protein AJ79_02767 [Helicocarpus griseus UAMH5409]|uniref:DUF1746 domain-containing protein n=1 Tax=Helicocarpus griseus UAMH5409 TaxID=1447875 RepID=A0A2B7XT12_9EURO|nr:hypothetical protein AJ79_02767 [Helicocarpus griseus UAMH5409]
MTTPDVLRDALYIADVSNIPYDPSDDEGDTDRPGVSGRAYRRNVYATSKAVMLERLLRDLDMIIYCELSAIYYMDCSILHFAIRAIIQFIFFTPKTGQLSETSTPEPSLVAVVLSNILCIFLHYVSSTPAGSETTRGYLHGGLFIDFIGEKAPISKFRLLLLDLLIFAMQIIMLCVILEKERTKSLQAPSETTQDRAPNRQDHDSEERGVSREDEQMPGLSHEPGAMTEDIEMQEIPLSTEQPADETGARLLEFEAARGSSTLVRDRHPRDAFLSAQAPIANINILQDLRDQWYHTWSSNSGQTSSSQQTTSAQASFSIPFIQTRFGFQTRTIS